MLDGTRRRMAQALPKLRRQVDLTLWNIVTAKGRVERGEAKGEAKAKAKEKEKEKEKERAELGWAQGIDPARYTSVVRAYLALDDLGVRGPPPSDGGIIDDGFEDLSAPRGGGGTGGGGGSTDRPTDPYDAIEALKRAGASASMQVYEDGMEALAALEADSHLAGVDGLAERIERYMLYHISHELRVVITKQLAAFDEGYDDEEEGDGENGENGPKPPNVRPPVPPGGPGKPPKLRSSRSTRSILGNLVQKLCETLDETSIVGCVLYGIAIFTFTSLSRVRVKSAISPPLSKNRRQSTRRKFSPQANKTNKMKNIQ